MAEENTKSANIPVIAVIIIIPILVFCLMNRSSKSPERTEAKVTKTDCLTSCVNEIKNAMTAYELMNQKEGFYADKNNKREGHEIAWADGEFAKLSVCKKGYLKKAPKCPATDKEYVIEAVTNDGANGVCIYHGEDSHPELKNYNFREDLISLFPMGVSGKIGSLHSMRGHMKRCSDKAAQQEGTNIIYGIRGGKASYVLEEPKEELKESEKSEKLNESKKSEEPEKFEELKESEGTEGDFEESEETEETDGTDGTEEPDGTEE